MKRASFIQSLSLILGGMDTTASLPFEDGPNHVIVGSNIQTIDNILSEHIKDKRHLKMFQHMIPNWVRSNKINLSRYHLNLDYCATAAYAVFSTWGTHDAYRITCLLGSYDDYKREDAQTKLRYEERLNKLYNSLKETQTA